MKVIVQVSTIPPEMTSGHQIQGRELHVTSRSDKDRDFHVVCWAMLY